MDIIRTTVSLPAELHEKLRIMSVMQKKSIGELISDRFSGYKMARKNNAEKRIKEFFALSRKIAKSSCEYDAVSAVREERNRDNA